MSDAGSAPDRSVSDEIAGLLLGEAAGDPAFIRDTALDDRGRVHPLVQDDREATSDVGVGGVPELHGPVLLQGEAHRRLVVLVERWPRGPEIAAGNHGRLLHQVIHRRGPLAGRGSVANPGDHLLAGRLGTIGGLEQRLSGVGRSLLYQLQLEERCRSDDFLGAANIGDAGELDEDLIGVAMARHHGLGHPKLVDAVLNRANRLRHRVVRHLHRDVRLHDEPIGAARARLTVERVLDLRRQLPDQCGLCLRHPADFKRCRRQPGWL